jgi:long-subunit fatty acid transport protein
MHFPDFPAMDSTNETRQSDDQELDMPMAYGIGLAYRFSDTLTVSGDIYRTEWKDFVLKDSQGNKTNPITGKDADEASLDATHQVRLGVEYLRIGDRFIIPIRGGIFYDPAPAEDGVDDYYGISAGSGLVYKRFVFDAAYQYRFGRDVGKSNLSHLDFSQNVSEHTLYSSIIIHF